MDVDDLELPIGVSREELRLMKRVPESALPPYLRERMRDFGDPAQLRQILLREASLPSVLMVPRAANDLLEESIAQLAPQMVRNAVSPSDRLYIKTPSERRADEMMMQRLWEQLSPADMRFFVEGNYGPGSV